MDKEYLAFEHSEKEIFWWIFTRLTSKLKKLMNIEEIFNNE